MTNHVLPQFWVPPQWHADFGDVQLELEHLRILAKSVLSRSKELAVELQSPEPGLMFLVISRAGQPLAEVYSNQKSKNSSERRFGLFLFPGSPREQEEYFESSTPAVELLLSACEKPSIGTIDVMIPSISDATPH